MDGIAPLHQRSPGPRGRVERPVERDQLGPKMPREPEITRIVRGQAGLQGQLDDARVIYGNLLDAKSATQAEARQESLSLIAMASCFHETDVRQLEREEAGRNQSRAVEPLGHRLCLRFAEQQGRQGRGVDDLSGGHDLRG